MKHLARDVRPSSDDEALCSAAVTEGNLVWSRDEITCWKCIHLTLGRAIPPEPAIPEHERMKAARVCGDALQMIGDFIDWLRDEKRYRIVDENDNDINCGPQKFIAQFFEIDEAALSAEKDALLEYQRAYNKAMEWVEKEAKPHLSKFPKTPGG